MHNYEDNRDGMNMDLLPDPDMTGAESYCPNCNGITEFGGDGKCLMCDTKIARAGLKGEADY
jgi:hypothetical protein